MRAFASRYAVARCASVTGVWRAAPTRLPPLPTPPMLSEVIPEHTVSGGAPAGSVFGSHGLGPVMTLICNNTARVGSIGGVQSERIRAGRDIWHSTHAVGGWLPAAARCPRYFDFGKYFTPGRSLKSASNVQMVASNCRAVAKMILSASGSLCATP